MAKGEVLFTLLTAIVGFFWVAGWRPKRPKFRPRDTEDAGDPPPATPVEPADTKPKPRRATYGAARYRTKQD